MDHFIELRRRINDKLEGIDAPHRHVQINEFPWLYGALGSVPAGVMFICENPSAGGVLRAHVDTVDGGPPDIEAQWWGGTMNPAAKRFRAALCQLGLKDTPPTVKGGWHCYITNVIKEMNVVSDHRKLTGRDYREMARIWAPVLDWELEQVRPQHVFAVGQRAFDRVTWLIKQRLIRPIQPQLVNHYSGYATDGAIISGIVTVVRSVVGGHGRADGNDVA
ncbi:MAG: uracil-DNA glycosylase family protein [Gemmatimonadaceae bacterium]